MPAPEESKNIAVRHQVLLERLKSGFFKPFNDTLNRLDKSTREALLSLDVSKISELSKRDLNLLVAELRTLSMDLLDGQVEDFIDDLRKLSTAEAKFEIESIRAVAENVIIETPPNGSAFTYANNLPIRATGELPKKFFGNLSRNEASNLDKVIRKGWIDGATIPEMVQRVRGTTVARLNDGFTKQAKRRIETQVRTATQHYSSLSRQKVWEDNSDIVEGYEWLSTLDSRTTTQCRSLDGQRFEVGEGPVPPLHYSCRSTTVPVLDESLDFLDDGATRASATGPVDADLTYYDWLKRQPSGFQDKAIGPTRGKLLRDGGLSADKFAKLNLNRNFEPLTLAEMERINPIAFSRAGVEL
jgi:SPP1 gp7 family putative phage head morphogenesis protein